MFRKPIEWFVGRPEKIRKYFDRGVFRAFFYSKEHARHAYGFGAILVGLLVAKMVIALYQNNNFGDIVNILNDTKSYTLNEFGTAMLTYSLLAVLSNVLIVVPMSYLTKNYELYWRVAVTRYYEPIWR